MKNMKKILVILLVLGVLFSLALPSMAAENPVKSYDSANNGDVLYEIDFSGDDGVLTFANGGGQETDKHFIFTPSADGTSMTITGNPASDDDDGKFTGYYGALINDLQATPKTVYSMTYKVKINGTAGKNNSIGFGGYYPTTGDTSRSYYLYGNFNTVDANGSTADRRTALSIINSKLNDYTMWSTLPAYEIDADGYVTIMLVYDGPNATITAYVRAQGAGDGSKEADWIKLDSTPMKQNDDKDDRYATLGVFYYSYYITSVDAVVKDAKIYKGNLIGSTLSVSPVTPNTPNVTETPAPTGDTFSALPVALLVLSGAAVAVIIKKKEN